MQSALLHVGADLIRSMVTVAEGLLVLYVDIEGRLADSGATALVSLVILAGGCGAGYAWARAAIRQGREQVRGGGASQTASRIRGARRSPPGPRQGPRHKRLREEEGQGLEVQEPHRLQAPGSGSTDLCTPSAVLSSYSIEELRRELQLRPGAAAEPGGPPAPTPQVIGAPR